MANAQEELFRSTQHQPWRCWDMGYVRYAQGGALHSRVEGSVRPGTLCHVILHILGRIDPTRVNSMRNSSTVVLVERETVRSQMSPSTTRQISRQKSNKKSKACRIRRPSNKPSLRLSRSRSSVVGQSFGAFIQAMASPGANTIRIKSFSSRLDSP